MEETRIVTALAAQYLVADPVIAERQAGPGLVDPCRALTMVDRLEAEDHLVLYFLAVEAVLVAVGALAP